jgi:hypothetical protein
LVLARIVTQRDSALPLATNTSAAPTDEIVFFDLPAGTKRADALALYRQSAGGWLSNPDLVEKYYFFDEGRHLGGDIYFWRAREAAMRLHDMDYVRRVQSLYGAPPRMQSLDALMHCSAFGMSAFGASLRLTCPHPPRGASPRLPPSACRQSQNLYTLVLGRFASGGCARLSRETPLSLHGTRLSAH